LLCFQNIAILKKGNGLLFKLLKKIFAGIFLLFLIVLVTGFLFRYLTITKEDKHILKKFLILQQYINAPVYEIFPKDVAPRKKIVFPLKHKPHKKSKVAIIIDDIGYNKKIAKKFLMLDAVITFSILPLSPFGKSIAIAAKKKSVEIMLHLPMEPLEYPKVNPGSGVLMTSMTPDQLQHQLIKNIDSIPYIKGVNNHMGSKMTVFSNQMYQIFAILKKKKLFFIDSRTTPESLCKPCARLLELPFAQRDVFLDHKKNADFIRKQINLLVDIAKCQGIAIGIAHPYKLTYNVLKEMLPDLKQKVLLVSASKVVHLMGQKK